MSTLGLKRRVNYLHIDRNECSPVMSAGTLLRSNERLRHKIAKQIRVRGTHSVQKSDDDEYLSWLGLTSY